MKTVRAARKAATAALFAGTVLAGTAFAPNDAHANLILAFSQIGTANTVTATAGNGSTTLSASNVSVFISALDAPGFTGASAFLNLSSTSADTAVQTADGVSQHYNGTFSLTSAQNGTGTNYLSGSFFDLFQGFSASATLNASTPPQSVVTFTSGVIPAADLNVERAVSFSFSNVTPGIFAAQNGTIPSFTAGVSGVFSANNTPVPEPMSLSLLGAGLVGAGLLGRRRR